ncbi:MAG: DAK2 domain-containing protein [Ruminococcaceae bacterium]|nr:DAK2 domain-containing protein [Oscillospiraceae bacterium]
MAKKDKKSSERSTINVKNIKYLGGFLLSKMARGGAKQLRTNAEEVNKLNVFPVPDGDTGDNMRMTIESGIAAIENMDSDDLAEVMKALSHGMLLGARGNSGVILSQFFAGMAKGLESSEKADPVTFGHALELGVQQAYSSVMTPTEGTILTVAREAVEYAVARLTPKSTIRTLFADLVKEMHESLDRTPEILSVLKEAGVVDSGGAGLLYIMDGFNRVLNGEEIADDGVKYELVKQSAPTTFAFDENSEMTYGYCTELLVQLQRSKTDIENFDIDALRSFLVSIGDSVVAFKTESIVKLHVHTFTPEKVIEYCRKYGEFLTVKIENMSVQHTELGENAPDANTAAQKEENIPPAKRYGIVAVSNGPGIENLFLELGVDVIVHGGQTQNPSTNDFLEAFEKISAEHIFVFPNNGNIFMAAQQAGDLYGKAEIHVLPSKNIGTGYVAVSAANYDNPDVDAVIAEMNEAMQRVTAGYVSPSIRDADMNGVHINSGDTIGIINKEIVVSDADKMTATCKLASMLLDLPEKFMLTVFCGEDSAEDEKEKLTQYLGEKYPDAEVYFIDGGQEIYPYIFVAE